MRKLLTLFILCIYATSINAQDISSGSELRALLAELPYEQCMQVKEDFSYEVNQSANHSAYSTHLAGFVVKGVELICEASRYSDVEIPRLQKERDRLIDSAAKLEEQWLFANRIDPIKFADFPGRDKSQKQNLIDADKISKTIASHELERQSLWELGQASVDLALNADPGGAADLIRRLLGELPPPVG
jgi:hypothetical protein